MLKVGQLLKFVSELNPQNTPTRLCFYNFIKAVANPEDLLTRDLIEMFFHYALDYAHWATNKTQLGNEVRTLLQNFNSYYQQKFDLKDIRFPQAVQIVELEHIQDQIDAAGCYVAGLCGPDDKYKIINDQNRRLVSVILRADRSIEAHVFDKKFTIRGGLLEPLRKNQVLYYTPELQLSPGHLHRLDVAPYLTAQFSVQDEKVSGVLMRGYLFQKLQDFKSEKLVELARLHFAVKRLEQFFVDRRTDNYYQDLVHQLERTQALVQQGDPEAMQWSSVILGQAETALEHIYIHDKLLALLVRDLKHTVQGSVNGSAQSPREPRA
jgi:hypothetical protein